MLGSDGDGQARPRRRLLRWIGVGGLVALIVLALLLAGLRLALDVDHLRHVVLRNTTISSWDVLTLISTTLCIVAIVGAVLAMRRRRMVLAVLFSVLWFPLPFAIESSRCDTEFSCRAFGWASLPPGLLGWSTRTRPVDDANEARHLATLELVARGVDDSPFQVRRFGDHWLASTIDNDGRAGPFAVRIAARTSDARLVPCPSDRIRCGMDWPTRSDGQRPYRNADLGISAVFPDGLAICTLRDEEDDHALGFVAEFRGFDDPCDAVTPDRRMGVEVASGLRQGCLHPSAPELEWGPLTAETRAYFGPGQPAFSGAPFIVCELHADEAPDIGIPAQLEILVLVTPEPGPGGSATRRFEAFFVTTPDDLAQDAPLFEAFLETLELGSPPD